MLKWQRRMLFKRELPRQERRWTRQTDLLTLYRITKNVGLRVPMNSRV
jgi:hypothetical protein